MLYISKVLRNVEMNHVHFVMSYGKKIHACETDATNVKAQCEKRRRIWCRNPSDIRLDQVRCLVLHLAFRQEKFSTSSQKSQAWTSHWI